MSKFKSNAINGDRANELRMPHKMTASSGTTSKANNVKKRSPLQAVAGYTDTSAAGLRTSKANGVPTDTPDAPRQLESSPKKWDDVASGVVQSTLPAWANVAIMTSLIFGGCCANVSARKPDYERLEMVLTFGFGCRSLRWKLLSSEYNPGFALLITEGSDLHFPRTETRPTQVSLNLLVYQIAPETNRT